MHHKIGGSCKFETYAYPLLSFNAQSVKNKKIKIETIIDSFSYLPILCITETWVSSSDSEVIFPYFNRYAIYKSCRLKGWGGVAILVPKTFKSTLIVSENNKNFEAVIVRLFLNGEKLDLVTIYRPPRPTGDVLNEQMPKTLITFCEKHFKNNNTTVFTGDFNYGEINWKTLTSSKMFGQDVFLDFTLSAGFSQLITFPTRHNRTLDLLFCNERDLIQNIAPIAKISDHDTIYCTLNIQKISEKKLTFLDFKKADFVSLNNELSNLDWDLLLSSPNINECWDNFEEALFKLVHKFVPLRTIKITHKNQAPKNIQNSCAKTTKLYKKFRKNPTNENKQKYLASSKESQRLKKQFIFEQEKKVLNTSDIGTFWKYVKNNLTYKSDIPGLINLKNELINDSSAKAELLNNYFASVFTADDNILQMWNIEKPKNIIEYVTSNALQIQNIIKNLKYKNSTGPDNLFSNKFFKLCKETISEPLAMLINKSLDAGIIPNKWKLAKVIALFKTAEVFKPSNYRPISLTSVPCKINETIVAEVIKNHMADSVFTGQHGFTQAKSTVSQLFETCEIWINQIERKHSIDVIYVDFAKAFDSVSHSKLIDKLYCYGIRGKILAWIKSFLSNRTQFVEVDNCSSAEADVISGVPQGSVLGPLLFLIFINDLPNNISNKNIQIKLFADDLKMFYNVDSLANSRELQSALDELCIWANNSQLKIQPKKCVSIHLGKNNSKFPYKFGNIELEQKSGVRDLGVWVNESLTFGEHISQITKSAYVVSNTILRSFQSRNHLFLMKMFNAFVRPKLEYASQIWNPYQIKNIDKIEQVQRRFTKRIPITKKMSYQNRLLFLNLKSLEERRLILDLVFLYKLERGFINVNFENYFKYKNTFTRGHSKQLTGAFKKSNLARHAFSQRIINVWNSLPQVAVSAATVPAFKAELNNLDFKIFLRGNGPRGL